MYIFRYLICYLCFILLFIYLFSIVYEYFYYIFNNIKTFIRNIVDVILIMHSNFYLSFIFVFNLLSLAGIPPLIGFYGKLFVFYVLMETGTYYIVFLVILFSVISCVYYISLYVFYFLNIM